ncbi:MAG TPA: DUF4097 family beta strand repeat-containing protein [Pyrinomonadaceae bacterium]|nr:DUF4097 family beta strand repeat-containing protein [Pyrinomonadaceae bacterium]
MLKHLFLLTSTTFIAGLALFFNGELNSMPGNNVNMLFQAESGTAMTNNLQLTERESRSFAVAGTPRINVENFEGSITVHAWDQPEVNVVAVKQATDKQAMNNIRLQADQKDANVSVTTKFNGRERKMKIGGGDAYSKGAYIDLEINVPRNANVNLSTGDGSLTISGVSGELKLKTSDGAIQVRDGRGQLTANTSDGRIQIVNFDGDVEAKDMGDQGINAEGRFAKFSATTGGGSIALSVPADANVTIETDTANINNEGLAVTEEKLTSNARRLKVGNGGNVFNLRTGVTGQVTLRRMNGS